MKKITTIIVGLLATVLSASSSSACPCSDFAPPKGDHLTASVSVKKGLQFSETPEYKQQFEEAIKAAKEACLKHDKQERLAIVSDIDETLLDNRDYFRTQLQAKDPWAEFPSWVKQSKAPVLQQTADFLAWARKEGMAIFLVTGRTEDLRSDTIANLIHAGISYDGLYMRQVGDRRSAVDVKTEYRKGIEKSGFKIIVNIGDQPSDLLGEQSANCHLLPNEMYSIR